MRKSKEAVLGRERRQRETDVRLGIHERVEALNQEQQEKSKSSQKVTTEDRLQQASTSTRDASSS